MEILKSKNQLHTVKFDLPLSKLLGLLKDLGQLASADEGHHEVESHFAWEEVENIGQEGVIGIGEDLQLSVSLSDGVSFHKPVLPNGFDCILFGGIIVNFRQIHSSKSTLTNDMSDEEVS